MARVFEATCRCSLPPGISPPGRDAAPATTSPPANAAPGTAATAASSSGSRSIEAALAATRTKASYLQAQYQRLKPRIGHRRALGAVQHSMLVAYWHMFTTGETYRELGGDYYARRDPERLTKRLVVRLRSLGHYGTLTPTAA